MADQTEDHKTDFAFPSGLAVGTDGGLFVSAEIAGCGGLTKRELFAAMAMQGTISRPDGFEKPENVAQYAVECADTLLKELAK